MLVQSLKKHYETIEISASLESKEIGSNSEPTAMLPVNSTMAKSIGYNQREQVLQIKFSSGSVYQYSDVDLETWASLQDADSTGRFFNSEIKGQYSSQRVDDRD